jgi:hypothetical protein
MIGTEALRWRHAALRGDVEEVKKDFEGDLQRTMPPGVEVKTNHFVWLDDYNHALMAQVDVSGSLGTATGKRVFLPAVFFEASSRPLFVQEKRENSVDLHFPYTMHDQFSLKLPPGVTAESVPKESNVPFSPNGDYIAKFVVQDNTFAYGRLLRLANPFYKVSEYPDLRGFYQKTNADDQEQVVLKEGAVPAATAKPSGDGR